MIVRSARIAFTALLFTFGSLAVLAAVAVWRLAQGPVRLDFLAPHIEAALGAPGSVPVRVGSVELLWDAQDRHLELRAYDVRVERVDEARVVTIPALAVRVSLRALLHGIVAVREIELLAPELALVREADGRLGVGLGAGEHATPSDRVLEILSRTLRWHADARPVESELRHILVRDGVLTVTDRQTGHVWRLPHVVLELRRTRAAVTGRLTCELVLAGERVPLRADASYQPGAPGPEIALAFAKLVPAAVAGELPPSAPGDGIAAMRDVLARVALPLEGRVHVTLDGTLHPEHVRLDLRGEPGRLALAELHRGDVPVTRLALTAAVDGRTGSLRVDRLALDLPDAALLLRGHLSGMRGRARLDARVSTTGFTTAAVARLWPEDAAVAPRRWVLEHIADGRVRDTRTRLTATVDGDAASPFSLATITGSGTFEGLSVRYLETMPAVTGVTGRATFSATGARFVVSAARHEGLDVSRGTVRIYPAGGGARIAVAALARGALAQALAVLDHDPVHVGRLLGFAPATVGGGMATRIGLDFPLGRSLDFPALGLTATSTMTDVRIPRLVRDWSLTDGTLALSLAGRSLAITGDARVQGVPAHVHLQQEIGGGLDRHLEVTGRVDDTGRAALALDPGPWLRGPVDVRAHLADTAGAAAALDLDLDLEEAGLDVPWRAVAKEAGAPGRAQARLRLTRGVVTAIERLQLTGGGISLGARATRSDDGQAWQTIDATALLTGRAPATRPAHVALAVRPGPERHRLVVTSDDAGALFRTLGYADAEGGELSFEGAIGLAAPGLPVDGQLRVEKYTLTKWPLLARLATLASLPGITSALSGRGIPFDVLDAGISSRDTTVTVRKAVTTGPMLALSLDGTIDRGAGSLDLHGILAPSYYGLNRAAGSLPVVGQLLTGTSGEGFHAIAFDVRGPAADPTVTIDPLASVAPGVLRDLLRVRPRQKARWAREPRSPPSPISPSRR